MIEEVAKLIDSYDSVVVSVIGAGVYFYLNGFKCFLCVHFFDPPFVTYNVSFREINTGYRANVNLPGIEDVEHFLTKLSNMDIIHKEEE